jgi:hypothetical protein
MIDPKIIEFSFPTRACGPASNSKRLGRYDGLAEVVSLDLVFRQFPVDVDFDSGSFTAPIVRQDDMLPLPLGEFVD